MSQKLTKRTYIVKKVENKKLSNTEDKIYRYVRLKPDKVLLMKLKEFANKLEVSAGSILNFCRNVLDLKGFSELRLQIAEDLSKANSTKGEVPNSVFVAKEKEYYDMFENIKKDLDDEKLKKANELFRNAERILIFDTENGGLSKIAEHILFEKGIRNVRVINSLNLSLKRLLEINENDLLLILSSENNYVNNYIDILDVCNSKILSIVKNRLNKISQKSDLSFYTRIENNEMKFTSFVTYFELLIYLLDI